MGETVWYRIVGTRRVTREDVLPARSGRFHDDPVNQPTSYMGESLLTVWKEAQAARAGNARPNPEVFFGWRVTLRDANLIDFRQMKARKKWKISEGELLGDPAPPKCIDVARALRQASEEIHGLLYRSVRNPPKGVCLALFLEKGRVIVAFERVPANEWEALVEAISSEDE